MSKPLWFRGKTLRAWKSEALRIKNIAQESNTHFFAVALFVFAAAMNLWDSQVTSYAQAFTGNDNVKKIQSPLFEERREFSEIAVAISGKKEMASRNEAREQTQIEEKLEVGSQQFAQRIYEIVGDTPIHEMVPFISMRDEKVAAFLVGIAKKESSFGLASPSKDGETCHNYWGYKGAGSRGTGMGYACFGSAEEAVRVVGDRIEVLVNKERNTPARMVDTWKCGTSCKGDPGAPGWVATVALYFEKLVG